MFWDEVAKCEDALAQCVDRLEGAQELIEKYNRLAPTRELTDPAQLAPLPPAAYHDTNALFAEVSDWCARRSLVKGESHVMDREAGNLLRDPAGESPDRSRLATSRNRVLRGPGATPPRSVHRERAGRMMEPREHPFAESTPSIQRKTTHIAGPEVAWGRGSAGVEERGMYARVAQDPGRSRPLHRAEAARAPR